MKKKVLAVLLTVSLVLSGTGTVMGEPAGASGNAAEAAGTELSAGEVPQTDVEGAPAAQDTEADQASQNAAAEPAQENVPSQEDTAEVSVPSADTQTDVTDGVQADQVSANGAVSGDEIMPQVVSSNEAPSAAVMIATLNSEESAVYGSFSKLDKGEADVTYDSDEAMFEAQDEAEARKIAALYGAQLVSFEYGIGVLKFNTEKETLSDAVLSSMYEANVGGESAAMAAAPVYPNYINEIFEDTSSNIYTSDPDYKNQWFHSAIGDEEAWKTSKGDGAVVAVIDTGVDSDHPDLAGNLAGVYETLGSSNSPEDEHSHGTHCIGIVAALENNIGGVGVAPKAKVISIRAADKNGRLKTSDSTAAIKLATKLKVNVISMSFGRYTDTNAAEESAIAQAVENGITLVAAAGNDAVSVRSYPAAYNEVISVASSDSGKGLSSFSNYGEWVDIVSPGSNIYSTVLEGKYGYKNGTSMACPVVSATAALLYGSNENFRSDEGRNSGTVKTITDILLATTDGRTYSYGSRSVRGGVQAGEAVNYAVGKKKSEKADDNVNVSTPQTPSITTEVDPKTGDVKVTLTSDSSASIYYTTDGSEPDMGSISYNKAPFVLSGEGSYTVNAIAVNRAKISTGYKWAASEVATKKITVKMPSKADYSDNEIYVVPDMDGEVFVVPGKSVKLTATVSPNNSSRKTLTFTKTEGSASITVNNSGSVKVASNAAKGDTAVIQIGVKDSGAKTANVTVKVSDRSVTQGVASGYGSTVQELWTVAKGDRKRTTLDATQGLSPAYGSGVAYSFKSGNMKVAKVDNKGTVTAVGNGSTTITVTALDGSNKSVKIKVKCMTPVTSMSVNSTAGAMGASKICAGKSLNLKPVFYIKKGLKPTNTKVRWSVKSDNGARVTVTPAGKVTCQAGASVGSTAVIECSATDGSGVSALYKLTVKKPVKYMGVIKNTSPIVRNKKLVGYKNSFATTAKADMVVTTGMEVDLTDPDALINGKKVPVCAETNTYDTVDDKVTRVMESDEYVVSVGRSKNMFVTEKDSRGSAKKVTMGRAGTYTVTYKATDGSGKKFTLKLKVK